MPPHPTVLKLKHLAQFQVSPIASLGQKKTPNAIENIPSIQFSNYNSWRNFKYLLCQILQLNLLSQFSYSTYVKFRSTALTTH